MEISEIGLIATREDFALYVSNLSREEEASPEIASFLEAMSAWTEDMDGYYANRGEEIPEMPSWRMFAEIVTAALSYE
ncbi:hypothetical protein Dxin01_04331 [Deinococcus xinjiangensis]|uniref:DUF7660 domain-containing protein n=1 Tax=Deinococcus xinjiangensis TaxID=457454 RepID=A0ABP9VH67_9DEIO